MNKILGEKYCCFIESYLSFLTFCIVSNLRKFFKILFFKVYLFIYYLFLAVLGLHCCRGFSLIVASGSYSLVIERRLLILVAFLSVEHGLWSMRASVVLAPRL